MVDAFRFIDRHVELDALPPGRGDGDEDANIGTAPTAAHLLATLQRDAASFIAARSHSARFTTAGFAFRSRFAFMLTHS
jgi:hypothetical protein